MNTNNLENYPSIFAEGPSPLVSNKYQFIKTSDVLESLSTLGWNPREMSEVKARKPHTKGFQKHLVRLSNPEFKTINVGDEVPELVLTNSHNGKNSFSFRIGIYRMVCSNGLIIPTEEFTNVTVKHVGSMGSQIKEIIEKMSGSFSDVYSDISRMKSRKMSTREISDFAKGAANLRSSTLSERITSHIEGVVSPQRNSDEGDDLWRIFNRAQENLMQGNFETKTKKGKRKGTSIRSIDKGIKMNEDLWNLAKTYVS